MKQHATLYSILTIILPLVLVVALASCQPEPAPSQPSKLPSIETQGGTKVYTNSKYNFTFNLCKINEFDVAENYKGTAVTLRGPLLKDIKREISISVTVTKLPNNTKLDDYISNSTKAAERTLTKFVVTSETPTTIGGIPAKLQSFTFTDIIDSEEWVFNDLLAVFAKDNMVYAIKYDVPDEFHKEFVDCFNLLVSTFKFR